MIYKIKNQIIFKILIFNINFRKNYSPQKYPQISLDRPFQTNWHHAIFQEISKITISISSAGEIWRNQN